MDYSVCHHVLSLPVYEDLSQCALLLGGDYPLHLGVTEVSAYVLTEAGLQHFSTRFLLVLSSRICAYASTIASLCDQCMCGTALCNWQGR